MNRKDWLNNKNKKEYKYYPGQIFIDRNNPDSNIKWQVVGYDGEYYVLHHPPRPQQCVAVERTDLEDLEQYFILSEHKYNFEEAFVDLEADEDIAIMELLEDKHYLFNTGKEMSEEEIDEALKNNKLKLGGIFSPRWDDEP